MIENIAKLVDGRMVYDTDINLLFQNWRGKDETIVAVGPHDDDPLIGAGMLMCELRRMGVDVYVVIITDGRKGYCRIDQKDEIVQIRKNETESAYRFVGVKPRQVARLEMPDSDLWQHAFKWESKEDANNGLVALLLKQFREVGATRFLLPNENDFHLDHQAAFHAALYAAIQASEKIAPDFGKPCRRDTILRYGVWSKFKGLPTHGIRASSDACEMKLKGVLSYRSQEQIEAIKNALAERGPFEFYQEFRVEMFPDKEYRRMFFGR